jgi:hypothetical protein
MRRLSGIIASSTLFLCSIAAAHAADPVIAFPSPIERSDFLRPAEHRDEFEPLRLLTSWCGICRQSMAMPGDIRSYLPLAYKGELTTIEPRYDQRIREQFSFAADKAGKFGGGAGYRVAVNEKFALRFEVRDFVFDRTLFGTTESTRNLELRTGFTVSF